MGWSGNNLRKLFFISSLALLWSCKGDEKPAETIENPVEVKDVTPAAAKVPVPQLNADSAYYFLKKQVDFGPRVPGTKAHALCGNYLSKELKRFAFSVVTQRAPIHTFDQKEFKLYNIIGSYLPEKSNRILLMAHWDCRPFADAETDPALRNKPIDGADDGASGVAVLLEIARQISLSKPDIGIDIFFTDLEDYGQPDDSPLPKMENSWCLGTQYWCSSPHVAGYNAKFGILLDMVGAKGAVFPKEGTGMYYAPDIIEKVWSMAAHLGYASSFVNNEMHSTTDDHLYVNKELKIPTIDIVHMRPDGRGYGDHHHKQKDNIEIIDPAVLKMVGQTVLEVVFREI
jgi:hypothetical protein